MPTESPETTATPWYRQFWPWFLFGLPAIVVVASIATVYLAVSNPDPLVDGNYYKHGLTINETLETAKDKDPASASATTSSPTPPNRTPP